MLFTQNFPRALFSIYALIVVPHFLLEFRRLGSIPIIHNKTWVSEKESGVRGPMNNTTLCALVWFVHQPTVWNSHSPPPAIVQWRLVNHLAEAFVPIIQYKALPFRQLNIPNAVELVSSSFSVVLVAVAICILISTL